MKLYGSYTSPFVRHCRIVLLETSSHCEFIETDAAASAIHSPTKKVPFLEDGSLRLTDSAAIIKYLREKSGQKFLEDATVYDRFCMVNTLLDASVNLFLLEKENITPSTSAYLTRQQQRITSGLIELNSNTAAHHHEPLNDADVRLACYLDWGLYRQRFTIDAYSNLSALLQAAQANQHFAETAPPITR